MKLFLAALRSSQSPPGRLVAASRGPAKPLNHDDPSWTYLAAVVSLGSPWCAAARLVPPAATAVTSAAKLAIPGPAAGTVLSPGHPVHFSMTHRGHAWRRWRPRTSLHCLQWPKAVRG